MQMQSNFYEMNVRAQVRTLKMDKMSAFASDRNRKANVIK